MNILVFGWYNYGNCGDESYKLSFPQLFPQHTFKFVNKISQFEVANCDLIILGGGNVLKPSFFRELEKIPPDKDIYAVSVGAEQFYEGEYDRFKHLYVRDQFTYDMLEGYPRTLIPDFGFALKGDPVRGKNWIKELFAAERLDLHDKVVVVTLSAYLLSGGNDGLAREALHFMDFSYKFSHLVDEIPATFIFLPFHSRMPVDDRVSNSWVASKCKWWKKVYNEWRRLSVSDTLDVIAAADLVISTRLHCSLFAYSCGTPLIDITHHSKNKNFLKLINREQDSLFYWSLSREILQKKVIDGITMPKHSEAEKFRSMLEEAVGEISFS